MVTPHMREIKLVYCEICLYYKWGILKSDMLSSIIMLLIRFSSHTESPDFIRRCLLKMVF